jgi:hypothetical protein
MVPSLAISQTIDRLGGSGEGGGTGDGLGGSFDAKIYRVFVNKIIRNIHTYVHPLE